ncbi:MAG: diaminopimelate epimerase [Nitrospirae bacterium]|nr:diaminopimelate epimerase [Nitrospirota bacterium]
MKKIPFYKMSGSGNDFILIDNRRGVLKNFKGRKINRFAAAVCTHRMSVGGDGLILIERAARPKTAHFCWRLFNTDGTEAELSGNGGRCAARFAYLKKIAPARMVFETLAGPIRAEIKGTNVKIQMPTPQSLRLDVKIPVRDKTYIGHFLNTGVPHTVLFVDDPAAVDLVPLGRAIRHHELFQPAGTNVNFATIKTPGLVRMRTYERGVEDETLACGTGAVATALIAGALGQGRSPMTLRQQSGMALRVYYRWDGRVFSDVFLEGDARVVYEGEMGDETRPVIS